MIGRNEQLQEILGRIEQTGNGIARSNVLFVTGEAGIGKSTLLHALEEECSRMPSPPVTAYAECSTPLAGHQIGAMEALEPWAAIMRQLAAPKTDQTYNTRKMVGDLAMAWIRCIPAVGDVLESVIDTVKIVNRKVSAGDDDPAFATNQQQVFQQYINFLEQLSRRTPLVLMLDDVHWADVSSVNLLFAAARQLQANRILFIVAYRPDDALAANDTQGHPILSIRNELERYDLAVEVGVPTMTPSDLSELLQQRYRGFTPNPAFERWLLGISNGNALFIAQFLQTLEEDGVVDQQTGQTTGTFEHVKVPRSVRAVIEERIRRLNDEARELLRYASVEGDTFTLLVLTRVMEIPQLKLLQKLRMIQQAHQVIQSMGNQLVYSEQTSAYRFSHTLLHKAMYDSLDQAEQVLLHQAIFDVLKQEWEGAQHNDVNVPGLAARIAVHADVLGEHLFAARVLLDGAKVSWKRYAIEETQNLIDAALRSVDSAASAASDQAAIELLRGEAFYQQGTIESARGDLVKALEIFHEATRIFERYESHSLLCKSLMKEAGVFDDQGNAEAALTTVRRALSLAELHDNIEVQVFAHALIGSMHYNRGEFDSAREHINVQFELAQLSGDPRQQIAALLSMSLVCFLEGDVDRAYESSRQSLELARSIGNIAAEAGGLMMVGMWQMQLHQYDAGIESLEQSLTGFRKTGDLSTEALALGTVGLGYLELGRVDLAQQYIEEAVTGWKKSGTLNPVPGYLIALSEAYLKGGNLSLAAARIDEAVEIARSLGQDNVAVRASVYQARIQAEQAEGLSEPERSKILTEASSEIEKYLVQLRSIDSPMAAEDIAEWEESLRHIQMTMNQTPSHVTSLPGTLKD